MKKLVDITPQEVVDAYKENDLLPRPGSVEIYNSRCCGLGALMAGANPDQDRRFALSARLALHGIEADTSDAVSWALGFDCAIVTSGNLYEGSPYAVAGFRAGKAARELLKTMDC